MQIDDIFWFGILPDVYYVRKENEALLYNTLTGAFLKTQSLKFIKMLDRMHERQNLGVIEVSVKDIGSPEIIHIVEECVEKGICKIAPVQPGMPKPIRLMPVLNLQRDVDKLKTTNNRSVGEGIMNYLTDLTIHVNRDCQQDCQQCSRLAKQFFHCTKSNCSDELDFKMLEDFIHQIRTIPLRRIAVTGGNIFSYSQWNKMIDLFDREQIRPILGIYYKNITQESLEPLSDYPIGIFIDFPLDYGRLSLISDQIIKANVTILFTITSQEELKSAEQAIRKFGLSKYEYRPSYTGENIDFFKDEVYLTEEDIVSMTNNLRMIFARQKMNTNFFGNILLLPNGDVCANANGPVLGNIQNTHISKMMEKELLGTEFWRHTRNHDPCCKCLYQYLCPSISNYEIVIGKYNLCHIRPNKKD